MKILNSIISFYIGGIAAFAPLAYAIAGSAVPVTDVLLWPWISLQLIWRLT